MKKVTFFYLAVCCPDFVNPFSILPKARSSRPPIQGHLVLHGAAIASPELTVELAAKVQPSVALVIPKGVRNMTARGSGFVVDYPLLRNTNNNTGSSGSNKSNSTYLITAAHVAAPGYELSITWKNSVDDGNTTTIVSQSARVVARNSSLDLALIELDKDLPADSLSAPPPPALVLATELPATGTLAFGFGWPASRLRSPVMTSGVVCGIADGLGLPSDTTITNNENTTDSNDATVFVVTDAALSGGMSGGPLVNATGHVIGVNALIRPDLRALGNYAISAEEVIQFLQQVQTRDNYEHDPAAAGVTSKDGDAFRVYLFNDPMNKRERVATILKEVAFMNETLANQVMMQAHTTGRGMVSNFTNATQAESLCEALRSQDLLVEVERVY